MVTIELLNGLSATSIIIIGSIFVLAYFSTNTPNMWLRHVSRFSVLVLLLAASSVVYHAENGEIMKGIEVWTKSITYVIYGIFATWIITFIANFIKKRELDNDEEL